MLPSPGGEPPRERISRSIFREFGPALSTGPTREPARLRNATTDTPTHWDRERRASPPAPRRCLDYPGPAPRRGDGPNRKVSRRSEEHTSELQSLMRISYAVFCLKKKRAKNK